MRFVARARLRAVVAAFVILALAFAGAPARAQTSGQMEVDEASGLHYLEFTTGGAAPADALPVVLALHGLGDNPRSFRLLLEDLPVGGRPRRPRAPMPQGADGYSWFHFRAAGDDSGGEMIEGVRTSTDRLAALVVSLAASRGGPARVVVCGFSQGGMLSFALAAAHPDKVALAVPVAGYLPSALWPEKRPAVRPLPRVLALHGEADRVIALESARWSVEALKGNGYDASLRSWPAVAHSIPHDMRVVLLAALVGAVEELSPPGTVLEGPRPPALHERGAVLLPDTPAVMPDSAPSAPSAP